MRHDIKAALSSAISLFLRGSIVFGLAFLALALAVLLAVLRAVLHVVLPLVVVPRMPTAVAVWATTPLHAGVTTTVVMAVAALVLRVLRVLRVMLLPLVLCAVPLLVMRLAVAVAIAVCVRLGRRAYQALLPPLLQPLLLVRHARRTTTCHQPMRVDRMGRWHLEALEMLRLCRVGLEGWGWLPVLVRVRVRVRALALVLPGVNHVVARKNTNSKSKQAVSTLPI